MIRRTSGSSIVRQDVGCAANGGVPLTIARAMAFSVRTCRPGRSVVRSRISSWARLLNAVPSSRLFLKTKSLGAAQVRQKIVDAFSRHEGRTMPVVDANGAVRGLLRRKDFLAACRTDLLS